MKRVYLVRHGESEGNAAHVIGGKDLKLSDTGRMQAAQLAERLQNLELDTLLASDFVRAQETLAPTATLKQLEPEIVPAFGEMMEPSSFFGYKEDDSSLAVYRSERNANIENPDWSYEDGESYFSMQNRINEARTYLENHNGNNILIVSHCWFIANFIGSLLLETTAASKDVFNIALKLKLSNTGISYLTFDENGWRVVMVNDHAHFAE